MVMHVAFNDVNKVRFRVLPPNMALSYKGRLRQIVNLKIGFRLPTGSPKDSSSSIAGCRCDCKNGMEECRVWGYSSIGRASDF